MYTACHNAVSSNVVCNFLMLQILMWMSASRRDLSPDRHNLMKWPIISTRGLGADLLKLSKVSISIFPHLGYRILLSY